MDEASSARSEPAPRWLAGVRVAAVVAVAVGLGVAYALKLGLRLFGYPTHLSRLLEPTGISPIYHFRNRPNGQFSKLDGKREPKHIPAACRRI